MRTDGVTRRALALSPHLDDAAFSCGGTLAALADAGWRVTVATLFTQSMPNPTGFALACQLDKGLGPEVDYMALRRAEDRTAMAALGTEPIHLPLPEAPHRGYGSAAALFGPLRAEDAIRDQLRTAIGGLLAEHRPDIVLAPQAIGGHVDHVQVVRALDDFEVPTLWWRDFPYVVRTDDPAEPFRFCMQRLLVRTVALGAAASAAREAACLAYTTQLGFQFGGPEGFKRKLAAEDATESFRASHSFTDGPNAGRFQSALSGTG